MKVIVTPAYGTSSSVYIGDPGDSLPWHNHPQPHGHRVIRGKTLVEIDGMESFHMTSDSPNYELPAVVPHQITVLEPDTIFLNVIEFDQADYQAEPAKSGGVMLDNGTVVYP